MKRSLLVMLAVLAQACWEGPLVGPRNDDPSLAGGGPGSGGGYTGWGGGGGGDAETDGGQLDAGSGGGAGGGGGGGGGGSTSNDPPFSQLRDTIFVPTCATAQCHAGNPPPFAPMSLEAATAWTSMVNRPSTQVPTMNRVTPGNPQQSYLMLKLQGGARTVGGTDSVMPLYGTPLTAEQLAGIRAWIVRGAPND